MSDRAGRGGTRSPDDPGELRERELEVAREIAEAFLTASSPLEVYRLALGRVTPLVGASFASVFLRDEKDPRLLRLVCAQSWPQAAARWLGEMRIMVGRGPTGRAVGRNRAVEVPDVFSEPSLREWWDPARELRFRSMTSLPLAVEGKAFGAVSFYFAEPRPFGAGERELLAVVAHQLASTAERARLAADLESGSLALDRQNRSLLRSIADAESALDLNDRRSGSERGSR